MVGWLFALLSYHSWVLFSSLTVTYVLYLNSFLQKDIKRAMGRPHVICMTAPPQFNANAQLICLNGQQSQAIDTFLNASSTDDGQVGTLYRVYLWHYLYVIQLAVFKFFISYWF